MGRQVGFIFCREVIDWINVMKEASGCGPSFHLAFDTLTFGQETAHGPVLAVY